LARNVTFERASKISKSNFIEVPAMQERRHSDRHAVSMPIRVKWKDDSGNIIIEEGLTENIGIQGTLIYLPRKLPSVGAKVDLTVTEHALDEVSVTAQVIRLERNASHPQVALLLTDGMRVWKKKVWEYAAEKVAGEEPDELDDW
jgi:hypothetical protein